MPSRASRDRDIRSGPRSFLLGLVGPFCAAGCKQRTKLGDRSSPACRQGRPTSLSTTRGRSPNPGRAGPARAACRGPGRLPSGGRSRRRTRCPSDSVPCASGCTTARSTRKDEAPTLGVQLPPLASAAATASSNGLSKSPWLPACGLGQRPRSAFGELQEVLQIPHTQSLVRARSICSALRLENTRSS